jgi:hypothetical protein
VNLAGKSKYKTIEHELKAALPEKMINYDYLSLSLADKR